MKCYCLLVTVALFTGVLSAADPVTPAKPVLKITPDQVIVPTDAMRRIWGELGRFKKMCGRVVGRLCQTAAVRRFTETPYIAATEFPKPL